MTEYIFCPITIKGLYLDSKLSEFGHTAEYIHDDVLCSLHHDEARITNT